MIGRTLSHFRITAKIGEGGMGVVYRAEDERLRRPVALKVLPPELVANEERRLRFLREARTAAALSHPNIAAIHEVDEVGGVVFIAMELVEGKTLRELIGGRPLPIKKAVRIAAEMAEGLAHAHQARVIHRDFNPDNVMVRPDQHIKILDFGLAKLLKEHADVASAEMSKLDTLSGEDTRVGRVLGTPAYMSPEQGRGEALTAATDVFSLGIVLYELAAGPHPFAADSQLGVLHGITSRAPLPPSRLNPEISKPLEALIIHMLEKDARLRPSAAEVERVLSGWIGKDATVAPGAEAVRARRPTVGREKEREDLLAAYRSARDGRGLLLCVGGEAGIGETTLVEELLGDLKAREERCSVARGRCSERLAGAEAYLPFVEALESLVQGADGESVGPILKVLAPLWFAQVTPQASGDRSTDRLAGGTQAASLERMKRELGTFFQEISRSRPLVVFFDDLHWADVSTVDLLAYLGPRLEAMRVLVVVTYRTEELLKANLKFPAYSEPWLRVFARSQGSE